MPTSLVSTFTENKNGHREFFRFNFQKRLIEKIKL